MYTARYNIVSHVQLPICKHAGRRLLDSGFKYTVTLYLQDMDMCELLRASRKKRVNTVHRKNRGGEEKGQEGERETERDSFHRFLKAYFM